MCLSVNSMPPVICCKSFVVKEIPPLFVQHSSLLEGVLQQSLVTSSIVIGVAEEDGAGVDKIREESRR